MRDGRRVTPKRTIANHTVTPNRRRATSGNNAPETKPIPVEPGGAARRDRLHAAAKARENQGRRTDLNLLENSPKSKPINTRAPLLRPSAWQHVIPGRLRHAIGSPHTLLMQAGGDTGRHQAGTRFAPALLRGIFVYRKSPPGRSRTGT